MSRKLPRNRRLLRAGLLILTRRRAERVPRVVVWGRSGRKGDSLKRIVFSPACLPATRKLRRCQCPILSPSERMHAKINQHVGQAGSNRPLAQSKWDKDHRERKNDINRAWRKRHPERRKLMQAAGNALWKALAHGQIVRGVACEHCGSPVRIEAAHYDYSQPLLVKWLCMSCHRKWDRQSPKTITKT